MTDRRKRARWKRGIIHISTLVLVASAVPVSAEEPQGTVDWVKGFIVATGQGTANPGEQKIQARLKATRAAEIAAQRALLEVIKGVRIDSRTTVKNMLLEEDVINTRVEGFLRGAIVTKRDVEMVDGVPLATVEMKVCMTGAAEECGSRPSLVSVLDIDRRQEPPTVPAARFIVIAPAAPTEPAPAPPEGGKAESTTPVAQPPSSPPQPAPAAPQAPAAEPVYDPNRPVTGMIINLEGRYFEREVLPVVITMGTDKSPKTVYSAKSVNPSVIRTYGAVRYAESLDSARQIQAVGNNPLIVTIEGVTKENMLVMRQRDASLVRETVSHGNNYLSDAKVVISVR